MSGPPDGGKSSPPRSLTDDGPPGTAHSGAAMNGTLSLIELAGHVGLLLWGTHMVGTGVQRGFGTVLRRWLGRNLGRRFRAFLTGLGVTALLQSSTATGLLATSFTATGVITLAPALAVMLDRKSTRLNSSHITSS